MITNKNCMWSEYKKDYTSEKRFYFLTNNDGQGCLITVEDNMIIKIEQNIRDIEPQGRVLTVSKKKLIQSLNEAIIGDVALIR